jgi:hypothetical protein
VSVCTLSAGGPEAFAGCCALGLSAVGEPGDADVAAFAAKASCPAPMFLLRDESVSRGASCCIGPGPGLEPFKWFKVVGS